MTGIQIQALAGGTKTLAEAAVSDFRSRVRGDIVLAEDAAYDDVRAIWNAMIDRRPALIVRCSGTADVMQAVRFAKEHQLLVSVRGAGHNIAGKSLHDGALLIDLSTLRSVFRGVGDERVWLRTSASPSAKNACSGFGERLSKGSTAIAGRSSKSGALLPRSTCVSPRVP